MKPENNDSRKMMTETTITIATTAGPQTVPARVSGIWAMHEAGLLWTVTHVPSGRAVCVDRFTEEAEALVTMLAERFPRYGADATLDNLGALDAAEAGAIVDAIATRLSEVEGAAIERLMSQAREGAQD